jgi:hypothetical protein
LRLRLHHLIFRRRRGSWLITGLRTPAVAFSLFDGQAIAVVGQPFHTGFLAIGMADALLNAITLKLNTAALPGAKECARAIKVPDRDEIVASSTI